MLYFETRDTADAYLADGLSEDVTSLLGNLSGLQVQSPGMVRRAQRAAPGNAPGISRALGVRYLVDGNVRRIGARVRVSARLVNGATGVAVWSDLFDRTPDELLALPSVIAREVAARVGGLGAGAETTLGRLPTRVPAAYDHFLRGNFFLALRSRAGIGRALAEYTEAERLDSGFAAAIGRAAYTYAVAQGNYADLPGVPVESLATLGLIVADRALWRDSGSSDAWMARGYLLAYARPGTLAGATEAFERAIALDSTNAEAHHQFAQILNWLGRADAAERELRTALAIDPGRAISLSDLAAWTYVRDNALALRVSDSAVLLDPASALFRRRRAVARLLAGDLPGALADAELAARLVPGNGMMESVLAMVVARTGDTTRARALIPPAIGPFDQMFGAAALLAVGDTAAALDRMERAPPDPAVWAVLQRPWFDALRGNPRFERLAAASRLQGAVGP